MSHDLTLVNCCSPFCFCTKTVQLECPLQVQAWANDMEVLGCPDVRTLLSALLAGSDREASQYSQCQRSCRSCRTVKYSFTIRLRGSTPDFLLGFTPLAFASPGANHKAVVHEGFCTEFSFSVVV